MAQADARNAKATAARSGKVAGSGTGELGAPVNGTAAGTTDSIDQFVAALRHGDLFGGRLDRLELKFSKAAAMPFGRLKIRLKKEIVTFGDTAADPVRQVGTYVEPKDWNELIASPDTVLIDTRNAFEVAIGTFEGAVDPATAEVVRRDLEQQAAPPAS